MSQDNEVGNTCWIICHPVTINSPSTSALLLFLWSTLKYEKQLSWEDGSEWSTFFFVSSSLLIQKPVWLMQRFLGDPDRRTHRSSGVAEAKFVVFHWKPMSTLCTCQPTWCCCRKHLEPSQTSALWSL